MTNRSRYPGNNTNGNEPGMPPDNTSGKNYLLHTCHQMANTKHISLSYALFFVFKNYVYYSFIVQHTYIVLIFYDWPDMIKDKSVMDSTY